MSYVSPKIARETLGVTDDTLRKWAQDGKLNFITGRGGHRRYDVKTFLASNAPSTDKTSYLYCRVSSNKQKADLERQITYLQSKYPHHTVVKEIASGINFKRKELQRLLDRSINGTVKEIVVAHRDRLCRIAWEHFHWLFERLGVLIVVDDETDLHSPQEELADDLMSIIHVFSCRHYGQRRKVSPKRASSDMEQENQDAS